jgi:hypothetical protein
VIETDDFIAVHAQQNQEQLNNFMKTLNELYDEAHNRSQMQQQGVDVEAIGKSPVPTPNEGEFRSYYVLYQLDNEGEVEKYLMNLRAEVLAHPSMQFALQVSVCNMCGSVLSYILTFFMQVVRTRRSVNYAAFFRLLRDGNYLQACCMFKYVSFMRIEVRSSVFVSNRILNYCVCVGIECYQ